MYGLVWFDVLFCEESEVKSREWGNDSLENLYFGIHGYILLMNSFGIDLRDWWGAKRTYYPTRVWGAIGLVGLVYSSSDMNQGIKPLGVIEPQNLKGRHALALLSPSNIFGPGVPGNKPWPPWPKPAQLAEVPLLEEAFQARKRGARCIDRWHEWNPAGTTPSNRWRGSWPRWVPGGPCWSTKTGGAIHVPSMFRECRLWNWWEWNALPLMVQQLRCLINIQRPCLMNLSKGLHNLTHRYCQF